MLDPANSDTHGALVFNLLYRQDAGLRRLAEAAGHWSRCHASGVAAVRPARHPRPDPTIGLLSGDFCAHAVGFLVAPAVEALSRLGVRIVCYANNDREDGVTARFRQAAALWRNIVAMSDDAVAERIVSDHIDILFDLSGFRLGTASVFARKPAPIQVAWVGCPSTTGLAAIDYLLADRHQVPAGGRALLLRKDRASAGQLYRFRAARRGCGREPAAGADGRWARDLRVLQRAAEHLAT